MKRFLLLWGVLCLFPQWSHAWPPTYGAEFEFTNQILTAGEGSEFGGQEKLYHQKFMDAVLSKCQEPDCRTSKVKGKWGDELRVSFSNGYWFQVSYDPACVEIQTRPSTLAELKSFRDTIDHYVFDTATEIGLYADNETGAGHFNMGLRSAFGDDAILFTRMLVDYADHPELGLGTLGYDVDNAPVLRSYGDEQQNAFKQLVDDVREGKVKSIPAVADRMNSKVYTTTTNVAWGGFTHYQAFNVQDIGQLATASASKDLPVEIRAVWPQKNAADFEMISELFEKRVEYLKAHPELPLDFKPFKIGKLTPQEMVSSYYVYIAETGLSWDDYKKLLPSELRKVSLDPFVVGNVNWSNRMFQIAAEKHAKRASTSPWIQEKLRSALAQPGAENSVIAKKLQTQMESLVVEAQAKIPVQELIHAQALKQVHQSKTLDISNSTDKRRPLRRLMDSIRESFQSASSYCGSLLR